MADFSVSFAAGDQSSDFAAATGSAFAAASADAQRHMATAHTAAMADLVRKDTGELRADILAGGFANAVRLSRTWQGRVYPRGKVSMEPAGYILTKAATIIDAFSTGITITVRNAQYLAIPEGPAKAASSPTKRAL
jgi:hypothetical protein